MGEVLIGRCGALRSRFRLLGAAAAVLFASGFVACALVETPVSSSDGASESRSETTPGACDALAGDFRSPPADLRWEAADGVAWPVSDSLGPTSGRDGWPVCFSHSPVGAALAATSIQFSLVDHSPGELIEFYVIDSPGKEEALEDASTSPDLAEGLQATGVTIVGFRVDEYTSERAAIRLVVHTPKGGSTYVGIPYTMVWVDDDWRMKLLDDGSSGEGVELTATEFEEWEAASG